MRIKLFIFLVLILSTKSEAQKRQIFDPKLSPFQKIETTIGIVDVTVEYSRPSKRGREIFGNLVPYGQLWRTGANNNTKIVFKDKVAVGNVELDAGAYTIFTKPNKDKWEVYFHSELDQFGVPDTLDVTNVFAQISISPIRLNRNIETLTINFDALTYNSATLGISWDDIYIPIPIKAKTKDILTERLDSERKTLIEDYRCAANIYFKVEGKSEEALDAINRSIELLLDGSTFENWLSKADIKDRHLPSKFMLKSEILADLGKYKEAIECAEVSLRISQKVNDAYYTNLIIENLRKWKNR